MGVKIKSALGSVTLDAENIASNTTVTVPAGGGTLATTGDIPAAGADTSLSNLSATGEQRVCQAWVNFDGTGTVAISDSFNVSSITDNGTGDYTVNYSSAMTNANYAITASAIGSQNADAVGVGSIPGYGTFRTTSYSRFRVAYLPSNSALDEDHINVNVFGD